MVNKFEELRQVLGENFGFIFFTETWLNRTISDSLLSLGSVYNAFRCDRKEDKRGGGIAHRFYKGIRFSLRPAVDRFCSRPVL